jgi:uncharacterized protein DUF3291
MAVFYKYIARVNALAERMPGFVWRLQDDSGDSAMALRWPGDPDTNVNMSVWETPDALARFVFGTVRRNLYSRGSVRLGPGARAILSQGVQASPLTATSEESRQIN